MSSPSADRRLIALIDESADENVYRVGALVIRSHDFAPLGLGLDYVAMRAARRFGLPDDVELHGHEIFHGNKSWKPTKGRTRERIGVYGDALDVVARHGEAVLVEGINRERFRRRYGSSHQYSEHEHALTYLIERLDEYAQRDGNSMFLLADNCRFAGQTMKHLARFTTTGTWGYKGRVITQIAGLEYRDSAATRQIQAADLVCYLNHRIRSGRDTEPRAVKANTQLWNRVAHLITHHRDWP